MRDLIRDFIVFGLGGLTSAIALVLWVSLIRQDDDRYETRILEEVAREDLKQRRHG